MSYTKRCTAAERKAFRNRQGSEGHWRDEPALGTLEERLDILVVRFGGRLRVPSATFEERASLRVLSE